MEYSLCAEALRVVCLSPSPKARVTSILESLFSLTPLNRRDPCAMELLIHDMPDGDVSGELVFDAPGLSAIRTDRGYHLRARGSFLALDLRSGEAAGSLSEAFLAAPPEDQRRLFLFAFLLLLSARGLYGLHAGGALWNGYGFLLAGGSGSGKTTLISALTRCGWQYLFGRFGAAEAGIVRRGSPGPGAAVSLRAAMFRHFPELAGGGPKPVGGKRLVDVGRFHPGRLRGALRPRIAY